MSTSSRVFRSAQTLALVLAALAVISVWPTLAGSQADGHPWMSPSFGPLLDNEDFDRTELVDGIAHYRIEIPVGPGEFDRIGLNRVVRERAPHQPRRSRKPVFLVHGITFDFAGTFLSNRGFEGVPAERSLPVFLAQNGYDVWGIDFRWTLVPAGLEDLSFMNEWGLGQDRDDLELALRTARLTRLVSGHGAAKMPLLGYSRGGRAGYALLDRETRLPRGLRQVRSFIALDAVYKAGSEELRVRACDTVEVVRELLADGTIADDFSFLPLVGQLATNDPDGASPIIPGLTNAQASLAIGAGPSATGFHLVGGEFGPGGVPLGLRFTQEAYWNHFLGAASAYQPLRGTLDAVVLVCDEEDSPFDDHLGQIDVPVLFAGAAGGNGDAGPATLELLASDDTQVLVIQRLSAEEKGFDYGHLDLLTADDAVEAVFLPILEWLEQR